MGRNIQCVRVPHRPTWITNKCAVLTWEWYWLGSLYWLIQVLNITRFALWVCIIFWEVRLGEHIWMQPVLTERGPSLLTHQHSFLLQMAYTQLSLHINYSSSVKFSRQRLASLGTQKHLLNVDSSPGWCSKRSVDCCSPPGETMAKPVFLSPMHEKPWNNIPSHARVCLLSVHLG